MSSLGASAAADRATHEPSQSSLSRPTVSVPCAGFTPGPWSLGKLVNGMRDIDALQTPIRWNGLASVVVQMEDFDSEGCDTLTDYDQGQANANLIRASPTLYEAALSAQNYIENGDPGKAHAVLGYAIALANGETL